MASKQGIALPIGYRFVPTDEELIKYYLENKVFHRPPPAPVIQEIDALELYGKPPKNIVADPFGEREWYFFVRRDEYFDGERNAIRVVGNGIGFWRSIGEEDPIFNSDGDVFAFKIFFTYFSGSLPNAKKTHWRMEEYRLPFQSNTELEGNEWVLGRIKRGQGYNSCC